MNLCRPVPQPCPQGTIDLQGNGVNDGSPDCQPLDQLATPDNCRLLVAPGPLATREGAVACALPWRIRGAALTLETSAGCLNVERKPYPRTLVNLEEPTTLRLVGVIPANRLGVPVGAPGWYRLGNRPWMVSGLLLHERYLAITRDRSGRPAFNTAALRGLDPYWYPTVNGVRAYLDLTALPAATHWDVRGIPALGFVSSLGDTARIKFNRSSFPLPGEESGHSDDGPDLTNANRLPAFRVTVESRWQARLIVEWDTYRVNSGNAYIFAGHQARALPLGEFISRRAWDLRQQVQTRYGASVPGFCNAADGYIPVPVLEAQAVLRP
jgi:hypothetical protein